MNISAYEIALIGVGGTIVGALTGAWVGYRLSISLAEITSRRIAAYNLRNIFSSITSRIRSEKITDWNEFRTEVQNLYDNHAIEFEKFRYYVSKSHINDYDAACRNYRNMVANRSIVAGTTQRGAEPDNRTDNERYLGVLDEILNFAKP